MRIRTIAALVVIPIVLLFALGIASSLSSDRPIMVYGASPEIPWRDMGTLSTQLTYPLVGERDCTTCDANTAIVVWEVPNGATYLMVKFETTADADAQVVALMVAAGASGKQLTRYGSTETDDYMFGGTLNLTGGKQVARHSNVYVDTITVADANGVIDLGTPLDSGHDRVCIVSSDIKGFKKVAFLATTLASDTSIRVYCRFW